MNRFKTAGTAVMVLLLLLAVCTWAFRKRPESVAELATSQGGLPPADLAAIEPQVASFCGDCHAMPRPESFPRDAWFHEVNRGYDFYDQSGRQDLRVPIKSAVYAYYQAQAPESLSMLPAGAVDTGGLHFRKTDLTLLPPDTKASAPAISHLNWSPAHRPDAHSLDDGSKELLVCDMRRNRFTVLEWSGSEFEVQRSCSGGHFAHAEATDLDGDGMRDYVLADLGSFLPEDHDRGRVLWTKMQADGSLHEPIVLASGLGRVADVRPADLDNDGDLDLIVAEFGLFKTGGIRMLINKGVSNGEPWFELSTIDKRHGTIHAPIVDLDGDGAMDVLALISQEYETIDAFHNDGNGGFQREVLFEANDPSFGSSGLVLADFDQDDDLDIIFTNGDIYDSNYLKPYHAIHWLERMADTGWEHHQIAQMPGVFRALPVDLDSDGDLDLVASAFVPDDIVNHYEGLKVESLIWLEKTAPDTFVRHVLEVGQANHAALEVADFDGDGDADLAVGQFQESNDIAVTIWWNETRSD